MSARVGVQTGLKSKTFKNHFDNSMAHDNSFAMLKRRTEHRGSFAVPSNVLSTVTNNSARGRSSNLSKSGMDMNGKYHDINSPAMTNITSMNETTMPNDLYELC